MTYNDDIIKKTLIKLSSQLIFDMDFVSLGRQNLDKSLQHFPKSNSSLALRYIDIRTFGNTTSCVL